MAKYLDQNGLEHLWNQIDTRKVDVEEGKGLSTNDYTNEDKSKLASLSNYDDSSIKNDIMSYAKSIEYVDGHIYLKDANGYTLGKGIDASVFIKDGFVQDVSIVEASTASPVVYEGVSYTSGKFIKFEWNVDGGSVVDYIMASEIGKVYTEGTAISMSNDQISVKVASGKNFISVEGNGLKVSGMDTDSTVTTNSIPVAGGPLAELLNNAGITEIEEGTDMQSLLMKLFCQEIYPSTSFTPGSMTVSMSKPSVSFSHSGTQEVGTKITLNPITSTGSKAVITSAKVSGFDYGYSETIDSVIKYGVVSVSTPTPSETTYHEVSVSYSGFTEPTPSKQSANSAEVTLPSQELIVREGTNTVYANVSGSTFTTTSPAINTSYYIVSNIGGRSEGQKSVTGTAKALSDTPTNAANASVTGAYKYFIGWSNNTKPSDFNSDLVRNLTISTGWILNNGTTTIVSNSSSMSSNGTSIVIAVPSMYKLATIDTTLGPSMLDEFIDDIVNVNTGEIVTPYRVYVLPITSGVVREFKNVTITKA